MQTSRNLPSLLNDGYPKLIRISEYEPRRREMRDKFVKVYSANDETLVRTWHDDMNRKLQTQQRRDDCAKQEARR